MITRSELASVEHKKVNECKTFISDFLTALDDCRKLFLNLKNVDEANNSENLKDLEELKSQKNQLQIEMKTKDLMIGTHEDDIGNVINVYKIK